MEGRQRPKLSLTNRSIGLIHRDTKTRRAQRQARSKATHSQGDPNKNKGLTQTAVSITPSVTCTKAARTAKLDQLCGCVGLVPR